MKHTQAFEVSCLFRKDLKQGCLVRNPENTAYLDPKTEAMYQGYAMKAEVDEGRLKRFAPTRNISPGFMTMLVSKIKSLASTQLWVTSDSEANNKELKAIVVAVLETSDFFPG